VATWNNSLSSGIAEDISFIVAPLPGAFSSCNTPTESYGAYEVVSGGSTASYVQPRFYASPDATLGIVVSANKGGLSTIPSLLNVFDRLTGKKLNTTPITYKVSMKAAVTAGSPQTVSITLDGATTPVTLNIP
jgi:hypothetical protein